MEPASSPDSARPPRGPGRFRSGNGTPDRTHDNDAASDSSDLSAWVSALSEETEMVALGSRGDAHDFGSDDEAVVGTGPTGPAQSFGAFASADPGPASPSPEGSQSPGDGQPFGPRPGSSPSGPPSTGSSSPGSSAPGPTAGGPPARGPLPDGDADHAGTAGDDTARGGQPRDNPWNRGSGTFGGFGLSGRNGRFLLGGRTSPEGRPGLNGRTPETNGRTADSASAQLGDRDGVDRPEGGGAVPADSENTAAGAAHQAERSDENGRDEMNGRAGVPGYPTTGETDPAEPGRRRDLGDATDSPPRRQATGWASVPTSTNPVVEPTSGAPGSGDTGPAEPASPGYQPPAFPYGQSAGYPQDPISGVPAPRTPGQVSPPAFPSSFPPAHTSGGFAPAPDSRRAEPTPGVPDFRSPFGTASAAPGGATPTVGSATPVSGSGPATGRGSAAVPGSVAGPGSAADADPAAETSPGGPVPAGAKGSGSSPDDVLGSSARPGSRSGLGAAPVSPAGFDLGSASPSGRGPDTELGDDTVRGNDTVLGNNAGRGSVGELGAAGRATTADLTATGRAAPATDSDLGPGSGGDDRFGLRPADEGIALGGRRSRDDDSTPRTPAQSRSASLEDAEPVRRGRRAAPDDDDAPDEAAMRPGDVKAGHITFWDDDATRHFREAWHEVKAEFVDDPVTALTRAHDLLTDAVNELTEALLAERDELDPLRSTAAPDTESMRMAMRGYREFLDRILAL
jgi:hypothetical protein